MLPEKYHKHAAKCAKVLHHAEHVITPCVLLSVAGGVHVVEVVLSGALGVVLVVLLFVSEVDEV